MTNFTLKLSQIDDTRKHLVGGKALAVAKMSSNKFKVPKSLCITTDTFEAFLEHEGLRNKILMEYYKKRFEDMRWEEIWDLALRIKNMFLKTPFPSEIETALKPLVAHFFGDHPVVVRSSAIGEDSAKYSFAGIHESYVNVRGAESILNHIKLVWASLYSDVAILYRQETGLDVGSSKMAVIIQQFINGQKSGVAFGKSPNSNAHMMIEAVYGLNQGLVDGTVEPDRWVLSRSNGRILSFTPATKSQIITAETSGTTLSDISESAAQKAALTENEIHGVYQLCKTVESIFGTAQDSEWTYQNRTLYSLQSRPITAPASDSSDTERQWYLSLKRSLGNLQKLRSEIEQTLIPQMQEIAGGMEKKELSELTDKDLANELAAREKVFDKWKAIYWDKFIPFAHAVRLFGEIYNRHMKPEDPYEFTQLLVATDMKSLERNRMLQKLAKIYASRKMAANNQIRKDIDVMFDTLLNRFIEQFRNPIWGFDSGPAYKHAIIKLLKQIAQSDPKKSTASSRSYQKLEERFVNSFSRNEKKAALELLDLARASYQLRDDDNIYLGKIEGQLYSVLFESKKRLSESFKFDIIKKQAPFKGSKVTVKPRQLTGQPAGQGVATGKARVIRTPDDLFGFKSGEILVCDAIDPNMTFVVPMASAIVERRGGMLVHGAIIAREYGLPCITGVPNVIDLIQNGQKITVDGYLGIVTIFQGGP
ncbi:MAG: PEP/pyruvate-binding domain-containing protein [Planctomycetota bacterium]